MKLNKQLLEQRLGRNIRSVGWLGGQTEDFLFAALCELGHDIKVINTVAQCQKQQLDCLIYYAPGLDAVVLPNVDVPVILYEPRSFSYFLYGHDTRFAALADMARRSEAVICRDEASRQWWRCFNENVYLLGGTEEKASPNCWEIRIAEMIVEDYLAGCSYAARHRVGLYHKVKRYYKEFGLRQTLHRIYEKLTGQED